MWDKDRENEKLLAYIYPRVCKYVYVCEQARKPLNLREKRWTEELLRERERDDDKKGRLTEAAL